MWTMVGKKKKRLVCHRYATWIGFGPRGDPSVWSCLSHRLVGRCFTDAAPRGRPCFAACADRVPPVGSERKGKNVTANSAIGASNCAGHGISVFDLCPPSQQGPRLLSKDGSAFGRGLPRRGSIHRVDRSGWGGRRTIQTAGKLRRIRPVILLPCYQSSFMVHFHGVLPVRPDVATSTLGYK